MLKRILPAALLALSACTIGAVDPALITRPQIAANEGSATLIVARDGQYMGSGLVHAVYFDGRPIGNLHQGTSLSVPVPAGQHSIRLACGGDSWLAGSDETLIAFQPGETRHIRTYTSLNQVCMMDLAG